MKNHKILLELSDERIQQKQAVKTIVANFPTIFRKSTETVDEFRKQIENKLETLSKEDIARLLSLLSYAPREQISLIGDKEEQLLVRYFSLTQDPLYVNAYVESALKNGYYVKNNEVILNDKTLGKDAQSEVDEYINQLIKDNPKIFKDEKVQGLFRDIVKQAVQSNKVKLDSIKQSLGTGILQDEMLRLIIDPLDRDLSYRIKAWLFLLNKANQRKYGIDRVYKDFSFRTEVEDPQNGQKIQFGKLESSAMKVVLNMLSNMELSKSSIYKWLVQNGYFNDKDTYDDIISGIAKLLGNSTYGNFLLKSDPNSDYIEYFIKTLEKISAERKEGKDSIIQKIENLLQRVVQRYSP